MIGLFSGRSPSSGLSCTCIATVALLLLYCKVFKLVHIVIPSPSLLKRDQAEYRDYFSLTDLEQDIMYHHDLNFRVARDGIVLIEESDKLAFEVPLSF